MESAVCANCAAAAVNTAANTKLRSAFDTMKEFLVLSSLKLLYLLSF